MRDPGEIPPRTRGLNAITGAMSLIAVLLMVQIWLLSATLDSYLAGQRSGAWCHHLWTDPRLLLRALPVRRKNRPKGQDWALES